MSSLRIQYYFITYTQPILSILQLIKCIMRFIYNQYHPTFRTKLNILNLFININYLNFHLIIVTFKKDCLSYYNRLIQKITVNMPHIHNCYFHENNVISHFCTRLSCTLPMCQKCLPIHIQEHQSFNPNQGVFSFQQALSNAITTLKRYLSTQSKLKGQCLAKMQQARTKIMRKIDEIFNNFRTNLDQQFSITSQIQKKLVKIQKGSLKTLIYFYSQQQRQINSNLIQKILSKILNFEKKSMTTLQLQHKFIIEDNSQVTEYNKAQQRHKEIENISRQRGYSFDAYQGLKNRSENIKSTTQLVRMQTAKFNNESVQLDRKKLSNNKSLKIINKDYAQVPPNYNYIQANRMNHNAQNNYYVSSKIQTQSDRQKQIQRIRQREQERFKQKEKIRQRQNQMQRERERQMQRQRQRQMQAEIEMQKQRERNQQNQRKKQKEQQRQRQLQKIKQYNMAKQHQKQLKHNRQIVSINQRSKQVSMNTMTRNQTYTYQNTRYNQSQMRKYNFTNVHKQATYVQVEQQASKKPLEMEDLKIETKVSTYKYLGDLNKQNEQKILPTQSIYEMNKQVLSPQQIRRMLQKRIQQRSRLINKTKNADSFKAIQQLKATKSYTKNRQLNSTPINMLNLQSEARWDTKDSIINQIYDDYRN